MLEFYLHPPRFINELSGKPHVSPLARWQAEHLGHVTNQRHELVQLDPLSRFMVHQLDGTGDRKKLLSGIQKAIKAGEIQATQDETPVENLEPKLLNQLVDQLLERLSQAALIVQ